MFAKLNITLHSSQIFAVTADNASNNDTLVSELESNLGGINSVRTRVRCFAHVLNLVVKVCCSFLSAFKVLSNHLYLLGCPRWL